MASAATAVAVPAVAPAAPLGDVQPFPLAHEVAYPVSGPDGNLWFVDTTSDRLMRMTPAGAVTYITVPDAGSGLRGLTAGSDGNLWTTAAGANLIIRITPEGQVTEFPLTPIGATGPRGIASGPDGNLWVGMTDGSLANWFAKVPTTAAGGEYYPAGTGYLITNMTSTSSGVYFVQNTGAAVGRIESDGTLTTIPGAGVTYGIAGGPAGQVWTASFSPAVLKAWTPGAGSSTSYATDGGAHPAALATGPDGNVWYVTTPAATRIAARMSSTGTPQGSYSLGLPASGFVGDMFAGPDGNMWASFTDSGTATVVRIGTGMDRVARAVITGSGVVDTAQRCEVTVEANGLGAVRARSWSWFLDGTKIAGADGAIYVPADDLVGKSLTCRASLTFEVGLVQMGFTSPATVVHRAAAAASNGSGGSSATTAPKRLKASWARTGSKVTASFRAVSGAPRNVIRATRKGTRARTGTCAVRTVKRARTVTCRITLPKGRWTIAAEARRGATTVARASRAYRIG